MKKKHSKLNIDKSGNRVRENVNLQKKKRSANYQKHDS